MGQDEGSQARGSLEHHARQLHSSKHARPRETACSALPLLLSSRHSNTTSATDLLHAGGVPLHLEKTKKETSKGRKKWRKSERKKERRNERKKEINNYFPKGA